MSSPQGLFVYSGLPSLISGSYTLSHGITPGQFVVSFPATRDFQAEPGTMTIVYGNTEIEFPDCKFDLSSLASSESGHVMTVTILDRRWKWQFGEISGRYNLRKTDGTIDRKTERTTHELATYLLRAMGEANFDVSQLPVNVFPFVDWAYANPAEELARLCDTLGCRVVLHLDNSVRIWRLGNGTPLPASRITGGGYGFNPPEMPDVIRFVCAPTKYQCKFELEAVGQDVDGLYYPIKDLSYNPGGQGEQFGWTNTYPATFPELIGRSITQKQIRALALQTVFRSYRITNFSCGDILWPQTINLKGYGMLANIKQCLPLDDKLVQQETLSGDLYPEPGSAYVEGEFFKTYSGAETQVNTPPGTRYTESISLDGERGIVNFSEPLFLIVQCEGYLTSTSNYPVAPADYVPNDPHFPTRKTFAQAGSTAYFPARITLTCSFTIRDTLTYSQKRHVVERKLTNEKFHTKAKIVKREDVGLRLRFDFESLGSVNAWNLADTMTLAKVMAKKQRQTVIKITDNKTETELRAKYYLDAEVAQLTPKENLSYSYPRIEFIDLDGLRQQVQWQVGLSGATTTASQNYEFDNYIPNHEELRLAAYLARRRQSDNIGFDPVNAS